MSSRHASGLERLRDLSFEIAGRSGPVGQVLHPASAVLDTLEVGRAFREMDARLGDNVRLVVSGAGLLKVILRRAELPDARLTSATILAWARGRAEIEGRLLAGEMAGVRRDFVVGVDLRVLDGRQPLAVGQFAILLRDAQVAALVWKSYPVGVESRFLAGFGSAEGRGCQRVLDTALGPAGVLVCHDAQAFNHRNRANVERGDGGPPRRAAMEEMKSLIVSRQPKWMLNLVHEVDRPASLRTFRVSYRQIHDDFPWHPTVVGAFGYGEAADPRALAPQARCPGEDGVFAILRGRPRGG